MRLTAFLRALPLALLLAGLGYLAYAADDYTANTPSSGNIQFQSDQVNDSGPHAPLIGIIGGTDETNRLSVTSGGAVKVDGTATTQPVSGTVFLGDGSETATVRDTGSSDSLNVAITDASGNQVTSFGGTSSTDDGTFTAASGSVTPIAGFVTTDDVNSGDVGAVGMTDDRALHTTLIDGEGDSAMDDANNAVNVTVISGPAGGTSTVDSAAFNDETDSGTPIMGGVGLADVSSGDVGVVGMTDDRAMHVLLKNDAGVDVGDATTPLVVQGAAAHDATVSGSPLRMGCKSDADETVDVTADGEATDVWCDRYGRPVVLLGHPAPEAPLTVTATSSGDTTVIAAAGASTNLCIKKGFVNNTDSANQLVALGDGAAGTERWRAEVAAEGGQAAFNFGERGWCLSDNTLLNVDLETGAGSIVVNVLEYYIMTP